MTYIPIYSYLLGEPAPLPATTLGPDGSVVALAGMDDAELAALGFVVAAPLPTAGADEIVYWAGDHWAARPAPQADAAADAAADAVLDEGTQAPAGAAAQQEAQA